MNDCTRWVILIQGDISYWNGDPVLVSTGCLYHIVQQLMAAKSLSFLYIYYAYYRATKGIVDVWNSGGTKIRQAHPIYYYQNQLLRGASWKKCWSTASSNPWKWNNCHNCHPPKVEVEDFMWTAEKKIFLRLPEGGVPVVCQKIDIKNRNSISKLALTL